ncbi:MAG: hypothetical protein ACI9TH_002671 [Kiritimatiellia bacterium]|jgi:hypothetical protein
MVVQACRLTSTRTLGTQLICRTGKDCYKTGVHTRYQKIEGLLVDLDALQSIHHRYDPEQCKAINCCCSTYEVTLGKREVDRIVDYIPLAAAYAPGLMEDGVFLNPFDKIERHKWSIDTDEDGCCVFAYKDKNDETRCSIHTAAMDLGKNPFHIKPESCALWPLAFTEGRPKTLTVMPGVLKFPCNTLRAQRDGTLDEGIAELIEKLFGHRFLTGVLEALKTTDCPALQDRRSTRLQTPD